MNTLEASNGPPRGRHLGDVGYPLLKFTAKLNYHWVGGREEKDHLYAVQQPWPSAKMAQSNNTFQVDT